VSLGEIELGYLTAQKSTKAAVAHENKPCYFNKQKIASMQMTGSDQPYMRESHGLLQAIWQRWKKFGRKLGDVQARLLLSLLYFTIFVPFALVVRWLCDPLSIKPRAQRGWRAKTEPKGSPMERALNQF
jgi:hypothetical protein